MDKQLEQVLHRRNINGQSIYQDVFNIVDGQENENQDHNKIKF